MWDINVNVRGSLKKYDTWNLEFEELSPHESGLETVFFMSDGNNGEGT